MTARADSHGSPSAAVVGRRWLWTLAPLALLGGCGERELVARTFGGPTMGTSWSVTCVAPADVGQAEFEAAVAAELAAVTARASTWDAASELARFNARASTEPFEVSPELAALVADALALARETGGAFDPTVLPLVRLHGFAAEPAPAELDPEALDAALAHIGFGKVHVEGARLTKLDPALELDLSGLAPGDAVDRVGARLDALGATAWLVEIGGEVRARGTKLDGAPWTIGVEAPREGGEFGDELLRRVALADRAVATSGDYRRFRSLGAQRVHHVIDPRTGRNPAHDTLAVTVAAPTCARADGLATALLVLGEARGRELVAHLDGVSALFVRRRADGRFEASATPGFPDELAR